MSVNLYKTPNAHNLRKKDEKSLSNTQRTAYALPQIAIAISGVLIGTWLTYFYLPPENSERIPLVSATVFAWIMFAGRLVDAVADPLIGYWSDRTKSKYGRRIPFILFGTPFLALSFAALFFPPFEPQSLANNIFLTVALFTYWITFTIVVAPYTALLPEIAKTEKQRMTLASFMALFMMFGSIFAALIGPLESSLDAGFGYFFGIRLMPGSGIQIMAAITAVLTLFLFIIPVIFIKEDPYTESKNVPPGIFKAVRSAFQNPAFRTYLGISCFFQMGLIMLGAGLPYINTQLLEAQAGQTRLISEGQGETWVGIFMGILILLALFQIPLINKLAEKWGKKKLLIRSGIIFTITMGSFAAIPLFEDPGYFVLIAIIIMSFPASTAFILPMPVYADVVDLDEQISGTRREGLYTGAGAVLAKASVGVAIALTIALLKLGNSQADPFGILLLGPTAAVMIALGTWIFSKHPIDK